MVLAKTDGLSLPQVVAFPGPVRLIRRNRDEMISTVEGELWSNRGNALLEAVLRSRYPGLATPEVLEQLAGVLYYPGALEAAGGQVLGETQNCLRFDINTTSDWRRRLQCPGGRAVGELGTRNGSRVAVGGEGSCARVRCKQDDDRGRHHPLHTSSYLAVPRTMASVISNVEAINL